MSAISATAAKDLPAATSATPGRREVRHITKQSTIDLLSLSQTRRRTRPPHPRSRPRGSSVRA